MSRFKNAYKWLGIETQKKGTYKNFIEGSPFTKARKLSYNPCLGIEPRINTTYKLRSGIHMNYISKELWDQVTCVPLAKKKKKLLVFHFLILSQDGAKVKV